MKQLVVIFELIFVIMILLYQDGLARNEMGVSREGVLGGAQPLLKALFFYIFFPNIFSI